MMIGHSECRMGMCSVFCGICGGLLFFPLPFTQVLTIRVPDSGVGILSSSLFELREIENYWLVREIYVALILSSVFAVFEARFTSRYLMQNVHKS